MFKQICRRLEIDSLKLSPASLRAGGATWLLDQKVEVSRIRFLGRWSNLRSLEHYLQVARAQQIAIQLSPRITRQLKEKLMSHFFMLALPHFLAEEFEVVTCLREPADVTHVVSCLRLWGAAAEAVQSRDRDWRSTPRGEMP